jgi:stage III sporulation protein AG
MKNIPNKIKELYSAEGKESKKKMENMVILLIILIITCIAVNKIWNGDKKEDETQTRQNTTTGKQLATQENNSNSENTTDLQSNLERILSNIDGVGKVSVLLTYSESSELVPLYDETKSETTTEEADTSGGKRTTTDTNTQKSAIMQENSSGEKSIITQKTVSPKIEGAIITAEGGENANVKTQIIQAVEAATGLATHKIQVFKLKV